MDSINDISPDTQAFVAPRLLERIGAGNCGSVWGTMKSSNTSISHMPLVIKREDASRGRDINNEVIVQSQVFATNFPRTLVPRCLGILQNEDKRWEQLLSHLPQGTKACRAMLAEKIEPVPVYAQQMIIDKYAPTGFRSTNNSGFEHCLVRIYLGRRRLLRPGQTRSGPQFFSLRNIPLHADQVEELNLPCESYARAMAEALAILHWKVRTNAADIEFVLGAPRTERDRSHSKPKSLSECNLWMLDFDCCKPITMDNSGLESIARAFWRNDPYYPRPGSSCDHDKELWNIFATEYCRVGFQIAQTYTCQGEDSAALCALVIRALERIESTKGKWQSGGHF